MVMPWLEVIDLTIYCRHYQPIKVLEFANIVSHSSFNFITAVTKVWTAKDKSNNLKQVAGVKVTLCF